MKTLVHVLVAGLVVMLAAGSASCAVDIVWTDAAGSHTVPLTCTYNAWDYNPAAWPPDVDPEYVWFAVVNVAMSAGPIQFHVSGNFWGGDTYDIWDQVRIEQHVTNLTGCQWSKFDIDLIDEDGWTYKCAGNQAGWSVQAPGNYAHFSATEPAYYIPAGGTFYDEMVYWSNVTDYDVGDGTITFEKKFTCIPEAGGLAVLLSGGAALLGQVVRKRRG